MFLKLFKRWERRNREYRSANEAMELPGEQATVRSKADGLERFLIGCSPGLPAVLLLKDGREREEGAQTHSVSVHFVP
jgi:hypothetical protein